MNAMEMDMFVNAEIKSSYNKPGQRPGNNNWVTEVYEYVKQQKVVEMKLKDLGHDLTSNEVDDAVVSPRDLENFFPPEHDPEDFHSAGVHQLLPITWSWPDTLDCLEDQDEPLVSTLEPIQEDLPPDLTPVSQKGILTKDQLMKVFNQNSKKKFNLDYYRNNMTADELEIFNRDVKDFGKSVMELRLR